MTNKRLLVYVAGPYSARWWWQKLWNVWQAWRVARDVWQHGHMAHCTYIETVFLDNVMSHDEWLTRDLVILTRCDAMIMCPRWRTSKGAVKEHNFAVERNMPIFYNADRSPKVDG